MSYRDHHYLSFSYETSKEPKMTDPGLLQTSITALVGMIGGGLGLKFLDKLLLDKKEQTDDEKSLRSELRQEATTLRQELRASLAEQSKLQRDYNELHGKYVDLENQNKRLTHQNQELEKFVQLLQEQGKSMRRDLRMLKSLIRDHVPAAAERLRIAEVEEYEDPS